MEKIIQILSVTLAAAAGFLYWKGMPDAALAALVGACLVFLFTTRRTAAANNKLRLQEQLVSTELSDTLEPAEPSVSETAEQR